MIALFRSNARRQLAQCGIHLARCGHDVTVPRQLSQNRTSRVVPQEIWTMWRPFPADCGAIAAARSGGGRLARLPRENDTTPPPVNTHTLSVPAITLSQ
ncbi:hypothetical protein D3C72_1793930 [compost metagenome]